jgi:hypothetical protein
LGRPDSGAEPDGGGIDPEPMGPTRYDPSRITSELTPAVVEHLRSVRDSNASPDDTVFMKVGASGTVNSKFLDCLAGASLSGAQGALQPTVTYFDATALMGQTSWNRDTLAAEVGRTAKWVQDGSPSPLAREIAAINPRFALVNYGTNDMQQGITYQTALWPFWDNLWSLLTGLLADGIIPIVTGLNPRSDRVEAAHWVPSYNEVTRAMAQTLQVPYLDLYNAVVGLDSMGLIGDGIHGNASPDGACRFDATGLGYNYNVRNLRTLELLDGARRTVIENQAAPDRTSLSWQGAGTADDPIVVDQLPFSHDADTRSAPSDVFDAYPACDSGQNEGGGEFVYRLELAQQTRLRVMVFDQGTADIDVHHLAGSADASNCADRDDKIVQGSFGAGVHHFVLDTFVSSNSGEKPGSFTVVFVECEAGDGTCG